MERKRHIETINKVKSFINDKDYERLETYIKIREEEIKNIKEDKASIYIENLVNELT